MASVNQSALTVCVCYQDLQCALGELLSIAGYRPWHSWVIVPIQYTLFCLLFLFMGGGGCFS